VIGVALLGSLVAHRVSFVPGLQVGMAIAGGVFLLGVVVTTLGVERGGAAPANAASISARE